MGFSEAFFPDAIPDSAVWCSRVLIPAGGVPAPGRGEADYGVVAAGGGGAGTAESVTSSAGAGIAVTANREARGR